MSGLWLGNLLAYSLQLTALVGAALLVTRVLPAREPRHRLLLWQAVFVIAVALPLVQPWSSGPGASAGPFLALVVNAGPASDGGATIDWRLAVVVVVLAGVLFRIARLPIGWIAVRRLIARATPAKDLPDQCLAALCTDISADVRLSGGVRSPATVGVFRPVILVPPQVLDLSVPAMRAVLEHEAEHVRRGDWLSTVVEELWCACLWFHPMARVLASQLDLAREMLVDRRVVETMGDRRSYTQALLTFAETDRALHTMTAMIRPRHLFQRLAALTEELPMSRRRTLAALVIASLLVVAATLTAVLLWPMSPWRAASPASGARVTPAQEDVVQPGEGVTLPRVTREVRPTYTPEAMRARIQGDVLLAIVVEADGTVDRTRVLKSLDTVHGLDDAAVQAARQWQFVPGRKDGRAVPVEVVLQLTFTLR